MREEETYGNRGRRGGNRGRNGQRSRGGNNDGRGEDRGQSGQRSTGGNNQGRGDDRGRSGQHYRGAKRGLKYQNNKLKKELAKLKKNADAQGQSSSIISETIEQTSITPITETESGETVMI